MYALLASLMALACWPGTRSAIAPPYIDPGAGSQLLQYLIAGGVGLLFIVKLEWKRISLLARRLLGRGQSEHTEN